jgi:hypothetical protein
VTLPDLCGGSSDFRLGRQVCRNNVDPRRVPIGDLAGNLVSIGLLPANQHEAGAETRKGFRAGFADTPAGPGDHTDSARHPG